MMSINITDENLNISLEKKDFEITRLNELVKRIEYFFQTQKNNIYEEDIMERNLHFHEYYSRFDSLNDK